MSTNRRKQPTASMGLFDYSKDRAKQNGRWTASGTATIGQLLEATEKIADAEYGRPTETQRPLHKNHCEEIRRYYRDSRNWVIPAFVFTSESGHIDVEDGKFNEFTGGFHILDGQHRVQALHLLKEELESKSDDESQKKLEELLESSVGLQYIENRGTLDTAQMFVDLNKSRRITATELTFLDSRNPIVNAVRECLKNVPWAQEVTDTTRTKPLEDSNNALTGTTLMNLMKAIESGVKGPMPRAIRKRIETEEGRQEAAGKLGAFLEWLADARLEWNKLKRGETGNTPYERARSYAYEGRFLQLMAQTWGNSKDTGPEEEKLTRAVGMMNLLKSDKANDLNRQLGLVDDRGNLLPPTKVSYADASLAIREAARRQ